MKLVTTSVVRGSHQGESHGGVYLIDLDAREVRQALDWNTANIDWQGRGWDRGLRGIAFDGETVYIAASDELFAYTPDFRPIGSWRNAYLKHCHEIAVWERRLYLASTGFDSILGFDLDSREFCWAMHVVTQQFRFKGRAFDPRKDDGPLMLNKLHLNNVHCTKGGMYLSGMKTGGMLLFNGREVQMAVELPPGHAQRAPVPRRRALQRHRGQRAALRRPRRRERGPRVARADLPFGIAPEPRPRPEPARAPGLCARPLLCCPTRWSPAGRRRRPSRSTTSRATSARCRST